MTAKIKLNAASGGGSFSLQAPSSSANTRVMTLPDTADGTILTTTNPKAGNILQVVSATRTDTGSVNSSSFTNISGLAVTITPSSSSNKILLSGYIHVGINDARYQIFFKFTGGNTANYVGGSGTGIQCAAAIKLDTANNSYMQGNVPLLFLDSPSTTSAITYQPQIAVAQSQTVYINRPYTSHSDAGLTASTITAMEVAA